MHTRKPLIAAAAIAATASATPAVTVTHIATIRAQDATTSADFGAAVAIDAAERVVCVGAPRDPGGLGPGALYTFNIDTQAQIRKITPNDTTITSTFARAVQYADTIALAASLNSTTLGTGALYTFSNNTGAQIGLTNAADTLPQDAFAFDIDHEPTNGITIVGAPADDITFLNINETNAGSAYLFNGDTQLTAPDFTAQDEFGTAVAIDAQTAIIGAPRDDDDADQDTDAGSAWLFDLASANATFKLTPEPNNPDDPAAPNNALSGFGSAVDIDAGHAIVGAPTENLTLQALGAVYVFDTNTGQRLRRLIPDDPKPFTQLGEAVALQGNIAVVGAPFDDTAGNAAGAVYIFDINSGNQLAKILPDNNSSGQNFGAAVDIHQNLIAVGIENGFNARGEVRIYELGISITQQPQQAIVSPAESATFTVAAAGPEPLAYQWQRDGQPLTDNSNITGASTTTLSITASTDDDALYRCVVSNPFGSATSSPAVLAVRDTCPSDTDADNLIGLTDLLNILSDFGSNCP